MPPVMYARASQTPEIGVPPLGCPNDLSICEVLDRCLSQNATGPDSLADGLYREHPSWSEETRIYVQGVVRGVTMGMGHLALHVRRSFQRENFDRESFLTNMLSMWTELTELGDRHRPS